jgi:endoglycosylceramidase
LDPLPNIGVNVLRLLFNWEAFEPYKGRYNFKYLNYLDEIIDRANTLGIYIILDLHQDAYSRWNIKGCGEGFPLWAVPQDLIKIYNPDNAKKCKGWGFKTVLDADLKKTWNAFFNNHNDVKIRFLDLWDFLSNHFKNKENLIGYDILNEPGGTEKSQLGPLYEETANVIRRNDPDSILFLTPKVTKSTGKPTELQRPKFGNFVYSPHYYDVGIAIFNNWIHFGNRVEMKKIKEKAKTWHVPFFLGEFGGPNNATGIASYIEAIYNTLDRDLASGTQWVYTPGWSPTTKDGWNFEDFSVNDDLGNLRNNFRVRPYPTAIAGDPIKEGFKFQFLKNPILNFRWIATESVLNETTEIFAPPSIFLPGTDKKSHSELLEIKTSEYLHCIYNADGIKISCKADRAGLQELQIQKHNPI